MICRKCNGTNDADAAFCVNCGQPLTDIPAKARTRWRRSYWYALLFVPVLLAAISIGYYLFILPNGVAAVVNDEEITIAELDAAAGITGDGLGVPADRLGPLRYEALSELITERVACQEARRAGIRVSTDEIEAAAARLRSSSGIDDKSFEARVSARYGSMASFRKNLERRLAVRKLINEQIASGAADPVVANERVNQWLQEITGKASVRVALTDVLPAAGCGCCGGNGKDPAQQGDGFEARPGAGDRQGCGMKRGPAAAGGTSSSRVQAARDAALDYWSKQNGSGPVEAKVTDFGCHIQVDILKENRIARSLRYQNGMITEM